MKTAVHWLVACCWTATGAILAACVTLALAQEPDDITAEEILVEQDGGALRFTEAAQLEPDGFQLYVGSRLLVEVKPDGAIQCYDSMGEPEPCDCTKTLLTYMIAKESR